VGGADGGECAHFLGNTECRHAILLEYSSVAVKASKIKDYYLEKVTGKRIYNIQGDAGETIGVGVALARKLIKEMFLPTQVRSGRPFGIIWSFQAVLHELPSRSDGFFRRDECNGGILNSTLAKYIC